MADAVERADAMEDARARCEIDRAELIGVLVRIEARGAVYPAEAP